MSFDNDYILRQVSLKAGLADGKFSPEEILEVAYDQLLSVVMPFIISKREEFYVRKAPQPLAAGVGNYPIPDRAHNLVLREVKLLRGSNVVDLERIDPEDVANTQPGTPQSFFLEGDSVVLYPAPQNATDSVQLSYFETPSALVSPSSCARITSIAGSMATASIPAGFTGQAIYDIVSKDNGHKLKFRDLAPDSLTADDITFPVPLTGAQIGDYICLAKTTPFAQVPDGVQPFLIMLTVTELLEAMESLNAAGVARAKSQMLQLMLSETLSVRVQGAPKRLRTTLI